MAEFGFKGSLTPFYDHYKYLREEDREHLKHEKGSTTKPELLVKKPLMTAKEISYITNRFIQDKELNNDEWCLIDLLRNFDWFNTITLAAKSFYQLMKDRCVDDLISWIRSNEHSSVKKNYLKKQ